MPRKNLEAELTRGLNAEQARAVTSTSPRLLLVAGAGAGKTTVLTRRVVSLVAQGVPPEFILCVTFTRKAAKEMAERIERLLAELLPGARVPEIRTLHAWGVQMIRRYPEHFGLTSEFSIYDEVDREDIVRLVARERNHKSWERGRMDTLLKDAGIRAGYAERLLSGNAIDFDMIERYALRLLQEHPDVRARWTSYYRHVLVDEYQDTNLAQVAILNGVAPENLCVVGDPRQSIYRFRGAEVKTIVENARDALFEVIELATNYRSVPGVVDFGNGCVEGDWRPMVSGRTDTVEGPAVRGLSFTSEPPLVTGVVREMHAKGYRWRDIAVLARNWAALEAIRDNLADSRIPVNFCGSDEDVWATEDGRAIARAILLCRNPADDNMAALLSEWGALGRRRFPQLGTVRATALRERSHMLPVMARLDPEWGRVHNKLVTRVAGPWSVVDHVRAFIDGLGVLEEYDARGLSSRTATIKAVLEELPTRAATLEAFCDWWLGRSQVDRLTAARDAVQVLTVHGAKGLEWPVVVLADARAGVFPADRAKATDDDRSEDLRVFYVAVTRARNHLVVTCPTSVRDPWTRAVEPATPSPYLARPGGPGALERWTPVRWGGLLPASWSST